ncbi:unnamed protein product [Mucor hiemalis]
MILLAPPLCKAKAHALGSYVSCILLMKESLKELIISDGYNHLLSPRVNLINSEVWRSYVSKKKTNGEIEMLENIIGRCPTLKILHFRFLPRNPDIPMSNENIPLYAISKFIPNSQIEEVRSTGCGVMEKKMLAYIMHKFPRLKLLSLINTEGRYDTIDEDGLKPLLIYLTNVKEYTVCGVAIENDVITKTMNSFWNGYSSPGREVATFSHAEFQSGTFLNLTDSSIGLQYRFLNYEMKHYDFMEKNGKFLKEVGFDLSIVNPEGSAEKLILPDNLIAHTFQHGPNVQTLAFDGFTFKNQSTLNPEERRSMEGLKLTNCKMHPGAFESLSMDFPELKHFYIYDLNIVTDEEEENMPTTSKLIKMPHTKIDLFTVGTSEIRPPFLVKVFSVNDEQCYYHALREYDEESTISTEEEYMSANKALRIEIWCQSNPIVKCGD